MSIKNLLYLLGIVISCSENMKIETHIENFLPYLVSW